MATVETKRRFAIPDSTPLVRPASHVVSVQWEPGLILHACPMKEEGIDLLGLKEKSLVAVNNPEDEGSGAGLASSQDNGDNNGELPEMELDSMEAREFGERLCEKTARDWAAAQLKNETSRIAVEFIVAGVSAGDIPEEAAPNTADRKKVKPLLSQGELMELPNSRKLLVKRLPIEPAHRDDRNPGRFKRLLGEEPVRSYVPLLLRPWVMDCTHKGAVHLGEKVALDMSQRYYWLIGMANSVSGG